MLGRKASFWLAVGGVAVIANFAIELLAEKINNPGLSRFVAYVHRGPSGGNC